MINLVRTLAQCVRRPRVWTPTPVVRIFIAFGHGGPALPILAFLTLSAVAEGLATCQERCAAVAADLAVALGADREGSAGCDRLPRQWPNKL